ncbi:MAG: TonB-dependent receptor [Rhodospirillaceae bacterium]|nr:TonB-dependent receptor [Rhodospirillaceae bacterium]MBT4588111.1 TonB-dependent receptor [Rhodospirillaceae bacterium]MBT7268424.1 TonB-dependent receptor [Rhodospirillaceae bacterium]
MTEDPSLTIEKALSLNLDPLKYGTIVEIGAGQEVSRWFFQAGAAAGTIAKSMSAYDMKFSDEIYGVAADQRYVSRSRLESMLEHEFDLIVSRISEQRPDSSRFFAFANTVTAQGFKKRADCHGWLGIRLQLTPKSPPDEIILHVRMLDETNLDQQEALGILGVNLIYGAYHYHDNPEKLLKSLVENLRWGRIEIDLIEMHGPTLGAIDDRLMALELVKADLSRAVLFNLDGKVVIPADTFYRKRVLAMRGKFYAVEQGDIDLFMHAKSRFQKESKASDSEVLSLTELTMAQMANDKSIDTSDFLARANRLSDAGFHVLISGFFRHFRVSQYLSGNTREPVAIVTGVEGLGDIFREDYYDGLTGGILEGLGQMFPPSTVVYVYPTISDTSIASYEDLPVDDHLKPLLTYLHDRNQIMFIDDYESLPT